MLLIPFVQFSCDNQESYTNIINSDHSLEDDLEKVNSKYSAHFRSPAYVDHDTLYCPILTPFDEGSYQEVLGTLILLEGTLSEKINVITFNNLHEERIYLSSVRTDQNIIGKTLPILKRFGEKNKLYQLHLYIVSNMTPSDFQVYNYVMIEYWKEFQIEEFESGMFYQLLYFGYTGDVERSRFHELMDILIDWSNIQENETSKHFEYFKVLFPVLESEEIFLDIEEE